MAAPAPVPRRVRFGPFELDLGSAELSKDGRRTRLADQPFQVLCLLLERPGEVVTREELQQRLWPADTFVDFDHSLNAAVKRLREALGDNAERSHFVETLPKRGYRLIVALEQPHEAAPRRLAIAIAGLMLVILVASGGFFSWQRMRSPPPAGRVMLAVLPIENLSGDPDQEFFSDGITEEMITRLGRLNADRLGVIASTSAGQYKHTRKSVAEIGRELGVDYILEGSVRREGKLVRINLRLIQVVDQTQQWTAIYESQERGLVALQGRIATDFARHTHVPLETAAEARLAALGPVNHVAYELYLRGRYHMNQRRPPFLGHEDLVKARAYFEKSVREDPAYAPAYSGLADAYIILGDSRALPPDEAYPLGTAAALRAVALDPSLAEAHVSLALSNVTQRDWLGAEKEYRRAIELDPNYAQAHFRFSQILSELGRHDEAIAEIRQAEALDPSSPLTWTWTEGDALVMAHRYDEAISYAHHVLQLDAEEAAAYRILLDAYFFKRDFDRHMDAWSKYVLLVKLETPESVAASMAVYRRGGIPAAARDLLPRAKQRNWGPVVLARIHLRMGEREEALRYLERRGAERGAIRWLKVDPEWEPLRSDPRFHALLRKMNLPD